MWAKPLKLRLLWELSTDLERSQQEDKTRDRKRWNRRNLVSLRWTYHSTPFNAPTTSLSFHKKWQSSVLPSGFWSGRTTKRECSCVCRTSPSISTNGIFSHGFLRPATGVELPQFDSTRLYTVIFFPLMVGTLCRMLNLCRHPWPGEFRAHHLSQKSNF